MINDRHVLSPDILFLCLFHPGDFSLAPLFFQLHFHHDLQVGAVKFQAGKKSLADKTKLIMVPTRSSHGPRMPSVDREVTTQVSLQEARRSYENWKQFLDTGSRVRSDVVSRHRSHEFVT